MPADKMNSRSSAIHLILCRGVLILCFALVVNKALAQKPVNGNGNVIEQVRPLSQFKSVSLDFTANLVVVNGETPSFHIEGEENILPHIGTRVRGGTLYISQDRWIEPSRPVNIRIGTPFTSELETSGYSDVIVENVKGPRMLLNIGVGKVTLIGTAERILVRTKTGSIDATQLESKYADIAISSHGIVKLNALDELIADINKRATIVYSGNPSIKNKNNKNSGRLIPVNEYTEPESQEIKYVSLTLVNNSRKRVNLRVEGPVNRNFSYGFSMNANDKRREDWPVGTRIYQESGLLSDKHLITITGEMQTQNVDLYPEE